MIMNSRFKIAAPESSCETSNIADFDYTLPPDLIAFYPPRKRTEARLMKIERETGRWGHSVFGEIGTCFREGDVLVLNNTKVIPARILGRRESGAKVELLLLRESETGRWEVLLKPSGRIRAGERIIFESGSDVLSARMTDAPREGSGMRLAEFDPPDFREMLWRLGHMPLPPYIQRDDIEIDKQMYQTVFAQKEGAVAAPTAGLHFDEGLLESLKQKGVEIANLTLHTGYGSFEPIREENIREHRMFEEFYEVSRETAETVNQAKKTGRRVIACGTTSVRALESASNEEGMIRAGSGKTALFIYPPYAFHVIDGLITNFHLPKSSLLVLVSAFLGREKLLRAYEEAQKERYRFYSYGDAMVIL